jgi:hypothetical protein
LAKTYISDNSRRSNISQVAIEIDLILIETETETEIGKEKENTKKDITTQETIAEDMTVIMIMTVLGTGNQIGDVMRETTFPVLHVETTLQSG